MLRRAGLQLVEVAVLGRVAMRHNCGSHKRRAFADTRGGSRARQPRTSQMTATRIKRTTLRLLGGILVALILSPAMSATTDSAAACANAKADTAAKMVCDSPLLSGLDQEMRRVFSAAASSGAGAAAIRKQQAGWISRRDACVGQPNPATCIRDDYLRRIASIRAASASVRAANPQGTSLGPFAFRCAANHGVLKITYVNVVPALAWVAVGGHTYALEQGLSGSGARYVAGGVSFWEHQGEATWQTTAKGPEITCKRTPAA